MSAKVFQGYVVMGRSKGGIPEIVAGVLAVQKDAAWTQAEERLGASRIILERDQGYSLVEVELWSLP